MATVEFRYDPKNTAWFTANAAMVLKAGEPAYHDTTGLFKLGDGVTALSALSFLPTVSTATPTIQQVLTAGQVATTTVETTGFIKTGGLATEFLKADGTVDSSIYLTTLGTAATSLTTTGSSGAATLIANVLNVPNYTLAGLGGTTLAAVNAQNLSVFAATTSSQLAGVISDETGSGALVFGTSPTFTTNITTPQITGLSGNLTLTNAIQSSGAITQFTFTNVANTNQTATTNIPNFKITGANKQWATGTVANQYFTHLTANTASFVGASTITNSYGLFVEAATAGTNATITNNYAAGFSGSVNMLIGTNGASFQPIIGSPTLPALYMGAATPDTQNYTLAALSTSAIRLNATNGGSLNFSLGANNFGLLSAGAWTFSPQNFGTANIIPFQINLTAQAGGNKPIGTNIPNVKLTGNTSTWATGALTNQYFNYITANTLAFAGTSTATNVYGLFVEAATAGTNATITNNYAAGFGGAINLVVGTVANNGITIRADVGSTTYGAIYMGTVPSATNYVLRAISTITDLQGGSTLNLNAGGSTCQILTASTITSQVNLTWNNGVNLILGSTTGTKIGTATTQKLSFWNATPIVQPTTAVTAATLVSNAGTTLTSTDTFDGYTLQQIVKALRNTGLLA